VHDRTGAATTRPTASSRIGLKSSVSGEATRTTAAKSRLTGSGSKNPDEIRASRPTRMSTSGSTATSKIGTRPTRPGTSMKEEDSKKEPTSLRTSTAGSSRLRGSSASKDEMQFGKTRNTSGTREAEVSGLNRTRGTSANKDKDLKFGKTGAATQRGSSKDKLGLSFGKHPPSAADMKDMIKLDPSMTTIKKDELQDLKKDIEAKTEELYNINIKMKKVENSCEVLKRDHKDELERTVSEMTEKHKK